MLFVEAAGTIITCATKEKYRVLSICSHLRLRPRKQLFAKSGSVGDRQNEKQIELVAFPSGKTASTGPSFRYQAVRQKFRGTFLEISNVRMNPETERSVALKPTLSPDRRERRNVSGARPSDCNFGGGAQSPSTAFAMMLRWISLEPA